jgi:aryl carrier-like protein
MKLTEKTVRADVAELLHLLPDEAADDDNLFEFGLDSIRLLTLVEQWRSRGAEVSFVELAEQPTLAHWLTLLAPQVFAGRGDEPRLTAA